MNGVHDMGGMQGMGPIKYEKNEPVFHARWEGRVYAMMRAMRAWRKWNIDMFRHQIELIPPAQYLRMSYYEKWATALVELVVNSGLVTRAEVESGKRARGSPKVKPALTARQISPMSGTMSTRRETPMTPKFTVGQRVRARNINPLTHTRLPRYARGKVGVIERDHGVFVFPDTNAQGLGEKPQHVYSVRFAARELWGEQAAPRDAVYIDMWDDYIESA